MKKFILILCILSIVIGAYANTTDSLKIKKIKIESVYINSSYMNISATNPSLQDFKNLYPESQILTMDMSSYKNNGGNYSLISRVNTWHLGFKFGNKNKTEYKSNMILKAGIQYFGLNNLSLSYYKESIKMMDSIYLQSGDLLRTDSISMQSINMRNHTKNLNLDLALIFYSNPQERWTLFGGIGLSGGVSLNSSYTVNYSNYQYYKYSISQYDTFTRRINSNSNNEEISAGLITNASIYIPAGIEFRIGKKREFWKQFSIFYEIKPGVNLTLINNYNPIIRTYVQSGLGFRVKV